MRSARSTEVVTPANDFCVTLSEAKTHVRVIDETDDSYITGLIGACQDIVERYTWRRFVTTTLRTHYDEFPCVIELPFGNVQSISSVKYFDDDGVEQTLATSLYQADLVRDCARIAPAYNESWPTTRAQMNAVNVEYVSGFGSVAAVPQALKQAILLLVGHYYENREQVVIGASVAELPFAVDSLIRPYSLSLI